MLPIRSRSKRSYRSERLQWRGQAYEIAEALVDMVSECGRVDEIHHWIYGLNVLSQAEAKRSYIDVRIQQYEFVARHA
jgi:hypothetical protein